MAKVLESYVCCRCGEAKLREAYGTRTTAKGRTYRLSRCKLCEVKRVAEKERRNPVTTKARKKRADAIRGIRLSQERVDPLKSVKFILIDCRNKDRKKGLSNDMTLEFLHDLVAHGCSYCEETSLRMTADRIDNAIGHTIGNVTAACIRCNLIRGSMPYDAWMLIVPGVREAVRLGLFGDWRSKPLRQKNDMVEPIGIEPMTSTLPALRSPI